MLSAQQRMFSSIADCYDLNNNLLSCGLHHIWKRKAVQMAMMARGMTVLDVCTGTADMAILLARQIHTPGQIIALDLNEKMLAVAKKKIARVGLDQQIICIKGNAEKLNFRDQSFDLVTVAFGIRNLKNIKKAFLEIHRVLKPGGQLICLEFSTPVSSWLKRLYRFYSFWVLPIIGTLVSKDKTGAYWYLAASISHFPNQEILKKIMLEAGFSKVKYVNLTGGIVAIHTGWKYQPIEKEDV